MHCTYHEVGQASINKTKNTEITEGFHHSLSPNFQGVIHQQGLVTKLST